MIYTKRIIPSCLKLTEIEVQQIVDWANSLPQPSKEFVDGWLEETCEVGGAFEFTCTDGGIWYSVVVKPMWDRSIKFTPFDDTIDY